MNFNAAVKHWECGRFIPEFVFTILLTILCFIAVPAANAALWFGPYPPKITRGPYLQLGTPSSVVVRWRTDKPVPGIVRYGLDPDELSSAAPIGEVTMEHIIPLTGLAPNTRYFYSVGTTNSVFVGGDTNHFFITAPAPGTASPTRVWVLGDSGTHNWNARAVRDAYYQFNLRHTALWLMLGDNAYYSGTDGQYQSAVFAMYPEMLRTSVLWPVLGNHDARSANSAAQSGVYYDVFTLPARGEVGGVPSGTEAYYSFDFGNIHFVCLDSNSSDRSPRGAMVNWLRRDLAANRNEWTIAFFHHPPYSKGGHDTDDEKDSFGIMGEMREHVLPVLEEGGVDLVLNGHSHNYERSFLLDGHYGRSEEISPAAIKNSGDGKVFGDGPYVKWTRGRAAHEGTVYIVAGSSGKVSQGKLNHPAMCASFNALGSVVLDIYANRLDATFLDSAGTQRDCFTLIKGSQ